MTRPVQLPLPLSLALPEALGDDDFLPAPCNAAAVDWVGRWPGWPAGAAGLRGLLVHGPEGCGKTHLAAIWARRAGAVWLGPDMRPAPTLEAIAAAGRPALVLDGADCQAARPAWAAELFHVYNITAERDGFILATARRPPGRWPAALPDLTSRLATLTTVAVAPPDDAMIEGLLIKLFSDRKLQPPQPVIGFLVPRLDRTFAAVRIAVAAIDAAALQERRAVTLPLVRRVLGGLQHQSGTVADDPGA